MFCYHGSYKLLLFFIRLLYLLLVVFATLRSIFFIVTVCVGFFISSKNYLRVSRETLTVVFYEF